MGTCELLERAARGYEALAASCVDESQAAVWREKARALRAALEFVEFCDG